jgi:hypothetical protein
MRARQAGRVVASGESSPAVTSDVNAITYGAPPDSKKVVPNTKRR